MSYWTSTSVDSWMKENYWRSMVCVCNGRYMRMPRRIYYLARIHNVASARLLLWGQSSMRREGNLVPSSARIKTFSNKTKRIPEPKQTKTQAKSQIRRATIGQMHPPPPPIKGRRQKRNSNKIKTKGFSKQETWNRKSWNWNESRNSTSQIASYHGARLSNLRGGQYPGNSYFSRNSQ